jgi:hypothetical protein
MHDGTSVTYQFREGRARKMGTRVIQLEYAAPITKQISPKSPMESSYVSQ